jgi:hypothetical protein
MIARPDRCIETCNALIEGVCKTVLRTLDNAFDDRQVEGMKVKNLVEKTLKDISQYDEEIEFSFPKKFSELVQELTTIRNNRGDISHGRGVPKLIESNSRFSRFLFRQTESAVLYLLESLVEIEPHLPTQVQYEDNPDFNSYLDDEIAELLDDKASLLNIDYSMALFNQDQVDYEERLEAFIEQNGSEEDE